MNQRYWIAFFSHTGKEIVNLSKELNRVPDRIVTNRKPGDDISPDLLSMSTELVYTSNKPDVDDYERMLIRCDDCVCTLHGWMRVIPAEICDNYEMYNLHPGLITEYPELKGKDPQYRVDNSHESIGLVIHRVTRELDGGDIHVRKSIKNNRYTGDEVATLLHDMAVPAWLEFLQGGML